MSTHVSGSNISDAWLNAVAALDGSRGMEATNLCVTVDDPSREVTAVRTALDLEVAKLKGEGRSGFNKSVHTVANTIFPISLYRSGKADAFYRSALVGQSGRHGTLTSWGPNSGTYAARLLRYPTHDRGEFNQLRRILEFLNTDITWRDRYEIAFTCEPSDDELSAAKTASASTFVPSYDQATRGGQCLSHISLTVSDDVLSMTALYRHQTYFSRAYGNFVGLARIMHFLVNECVKDLQVGELMIVASHAEIDTGARSAAKGILESNIPADLSAATEIEWQSRPFGSSWSDLDLPSFS